MTIYLVRHGKSDKSLEHTLSHDEFELQRTLVSGEEEKARQLGVSLKKQFSSPLSYDLVFSGKIRSKQTVLAIAEGFDLSTEEALSHLREDFGLTYLADKAYWTACEQAIKNESFGSHADFFLSTSPEKFFEENSILQPGQTFNAEYMRQNMRAVLRRAIERNIFLKNNLCVMVSHEPVLSLCMSDLTEKSVHDLGGQWSELEYATLIIESSNDSLHPEVTLRFRENDYEVSSKLFSLGSSK